MELRKECKNPKSDLIKPNGNVTEPNGNVTEPGGNNGKPIGNVTEPDSNNGKPNCGAITNVFLVHLLWICLLLT